MENREPGERRFFSIEERARSLFGEQGEEHFQLWRSLVGESSLNEENKSRFIKILSKSFNPNQYGMVESFFDVILRELWDAIVYSYQTDEALAIYHNVKSDMEDFKKTLYNR